MGYAVGMREIPEAGLRRVEAHDERGVAELVRMMEIPETGLRIVVVDVAEVLRTIRRIVGDTKSGIETSSIGARL